MRFINEKNHYCQKCSTFIPESQLYKENKRLGRLRCNCCHGLVRHKIRIYKVKKSSPTEIRTLAKGFKVLCANPYTIGLLADNLPNNRTQKAQGAFHAKIRGWKYKSGRKIGQIKQNVSEINCWSL